MSDQDRRQAEPEQSQEDSLFGKLPSARPGVRSPRRRAEGAKGRPAHTPKASESPSPPTRPEAAREPEAPDGDPPGVEDLAWAGVTVAAEAATLGVRLLSRAIEAVRKPAERR